MNDQELGEIVDEVARRYARRCRWTDLDDLRSEGWRAGIDARSYAPPTAERAYYRRAVALQLRHYVWRESSPVTINTRKPPPNALALRYEILCHNNGRASDEDDPIESLPALDESQESTVGRARWLDALDRRVRRLARCVARAPELQEAAARVVLLESSSAEAAARAGYAQPTVKAAANRLRARVRRDRQILQLRACM